MTELTNTYPTKASTFYMQEEMGKWLIACFPEDNPVRKDVRALRFLEEAIELFQACGGKPGKVFEMVDHVFKGEPGHVPQEFGGVYVTLMSLGTACDLDVGLAGLDELKSAYGRIEKIREKSKTKVKTGEARVASRFEFLMWLYENVLMPNRPSIFTDILAEKFKDATGKEAPSL